MHSAGQCPPPTTGERMGGLSPSRGGALVHGGPCLVLASTRGLVAGHPSPYPPITHWA